MRKQCKRKPRDISAMLRRRTGLYQSQKVDLGNAYHMALCAMETGYGSEQSWSTLMCVINLAMMLCERSILPNYLHDIEMAMYAMTQSKARADRFDNWGFSGDELRQVRRSLAIHDEQNATAPVGLIEKCLQEMFTILKA